MRERSLVVFTVTAQLAVGLFWATLLAELVADAVRAASGSAGTVVDDAGRWLLPVVVALMVVAATTSLAHLGSPRNAWRALGNVRRSWLSREILFVGAFSVGAAGVAVLQWTRIGSAGWRGGAAGAAALLGGALLYAMSRVYRLRTVPAWDTRLTPAAFLLTAASLGPLAAALALAFALGAGAASRSAGTTAALMLLLVLSSASVATELFLEPLWTERRRRARSSVDPGLFPELRGRFPVGSAATPPFPTARQARTALLVTMLAGNAAAWVAVAARAVDEPAPTPFLVVALAVAFGAGISAALVGRTAFYRSHARVGL